MAGVLGRRRCAAAAAVVSLLTVAGCAGASAASPGSVPDAPAGEQVTLFTVDDVRESVYRFVVYGAVPLRDGTVLVSYDVSAESGGDETSTKPRLALLGADGVLVAVELPVLDGVRVGQGSGLLGATADGIYYLWDRSTERMVSRGPGDRWRVVPVQVHGNTFTPVSAVGADGSLYVVSAGDVLRVAPDDTVTRIANVVPPEVADDLTSGAEGLPRPATEVLLPQPFGMAVDRDGAVYLSSRDDVVVVRPDGIVRYVGSTVGLLAAAGVRTEPSVGSPSPYFFGGLGIDADGALLLSDYTTQHLLRLDDSGPVVLGTDVVLAANGLNASFSPHNDLLVLELDPDAALAGSDDPVQLAAFGR